MKISETIAKIGKIGIARPNRFMMEFSGNCPIPSADANRRFAFMCQGAMIPSKSFMTAEINRMAGPIEKIPYSKQVNNRLDFTFYLGEDMFERVFFEVWQSRMQNPRSFNFKYPDTYQAEVNIYQLDENNNVLYATKLVNAFPESIGDLAYDSSSKNTLHTQIVSIGFQKSYYGIPRPRNKSGGTIVWEGEDYSDDFGIIDPNVESESSKDTGFMGHLIEAVASAGSVLYRKHSSPADWLSAGSILLAQGTPDYYNSLNILNGILGNGPQPNDQGAPVITVPGL